MIVAKSGWMMLEEGDTPIVSGLEEAEAGISLRNLQDFIPVYRVSILVLSRILVISNKAQTENFTSSKSAFKIFPVWSHWDYTMQ